MAARATPSDSLSGGPIALNHGGSNTNCTAPMPAERVRDGSGMFDGSSPRAAGRKL